MGTVRFLKVIIISLLLINIATLTFLWMNMPDRREEKKRETPGEFLTRELKLTPDQERQYERMRHDHHSHVEAIRMEAAEIRHTIIGLLSTSVKDTQRINILADSIGQLQKSAELITYDHFRELRQICTPEQQKRFDEVIYEAVQMMGPPPRRRPEEREH